MAKKKDTDVSVAMDVPTSFKFDQIGPDDKRLDFEMMGKVLDNILILVKEDKKPLTEGKDYTIEFEVGHKEKYKGNIHVFKKYIQFTVIYVRELTKLEARDSKNRAQPPKVKKEIESIMKKSKEDVVKHVQEKSKEK